MALDHSELLWEWWIQRSNESFAYGFDAAIAVLMVPSIFIVKPLGSVSLRGAAAPTRAKGIFMLTPPELAAIGLRLS
ncbi:MAG: hypothetical protein AAFX01_05665 [Cyanobacteria bacterium J06638_28]